MTARKLIPTALALMYVTVATPVAAQDVAGRWVLSIDLGVNKGAAVVVLAVEDTTVTGTYTSILMGEHPVAGTVDGNAVEFAFDSPEWGCVMFRGVSEGNLMEGTLEYGALGPGSFTGSRVRRGAPRFSSDMEFNNFRITDPRGGIGRTP